MKARSALLLLAVAGCGLDDFDWDNCSVPWEMRIEHEEELPDELEPLKRGLPARNVKQQGDSVQWEIELEDLRLRFRIDEGQFSTQHLFVGEREGEAQRGFFEGTCTHDRRESDMYDEKLDRYVCNGLSYSESDPVRRRSKLVLEQVDRCGTN
ncbi:hypothetical protein [Vulgatibacter sp.]|uniref:hypothetical protein n=1 Tax=Vulgatibacter sp. TaxID=1971226 RepID=UPI0035629FD0